MFRILLISAVGLVATALLFLLLSYEQNNDEYNRQSSKPTPLALPLEHNEKIDLAILPVLSSTKGKEFRLYSGLKDVFDAIILDADSQSKDILVAFAQKYCDAEALLVSACEEFTSLFTRYIDYKLALFEVEAQTVNYASALEEIRYRLDNINDLKYEFFTDLEVQVLFGFEQNIEASALSRYEIAADQTLSKEAKKFLIEQHFASLPEEEKLAFAPSLQIQKLQRIKNQTDPQHHRLALARAEFGEEAASRLKATWDKQAQFKLKVEALKNSYQEIEKQNQLAWLQQHFPDNLAKRARVLLKDEESR